MDTEKIGQLISQLRKEKQLTQQQLAEALHITNKTISKWECGKGIPDITLWEPLAQLLGADILKLLQGNLSLNTIDTGNIRRLKIFVCPHCGNILTSTSTTTITCCGRSLTALTAMLNDTTHKPNVISIDGANYLTFTHTMTKEEYIYFVAYIYDDFIWLQRLYPEQEPAIQLPRLKRGGKLLVYCLNHGLFSYQHII
ncbi:helix-turn-helix domain-containing protein [Veillonella criceti]|uniref:Transcriptional repressor DicA n=1 Tax=Veillonella criceti TaxID=103891 RepID=A0A380NLB7_9FIRM|nr:helix-turn-helix domain-containing protein [Veillonella criceti]SUP43659.1 transcriptional repressor DicA [Veillonella criceti]